MPTDASVFVGLILAIVCGQSVQRFHRPLAVTVDVEHLFITPWLLVTTFVQNACLIHLLPFPYCASEAF